MTKLEAITLLLTITNECDRQDSEGGCCKTCPFGSGNSCLASEGNDIPHNWNIKDRLREMV